MKSSDPTGRIAVVGPHPPYRGGIAHFTDRVCTQLESEGQEVMRVSFSRLYPGFLFPGKTQFEPGTPGDWMASWRDRDDAALIDSLSPFSWLAVAKRIQQARVEAVVFMVWMPFFSPAFSMIARRLKKAGIPVLAIIHNALPHERHKGDRWLSSTFLRRCDSVAVLSGSVRADVNRLASELKPMLIPHPVYDHFGDIIPRSEAREQLGWSENDSIILFFGMVRSYKGLGVLLEAVALARSAVKGLKLVVAGEFYDDRSVYDARIQALGIEADVTIFDEYIHAERVPALFCASDGVVQPYLTATQSGIVQTAIHFERPVIVTSVGGLSEFLRDPEAGLVVEPGDSKALAGAISHLFEEGVGERLSAGGRALKEASSWAGFSTFILSEINRG